jgi:hypothetical protein
MPQNWGNRKEREREKAKKWRKIANKREYTCVIKGTKVLKKTGK